MKPQLIVDISDRILSALLVTPEGQLLPFSQEILGVSTRYLSSEILFDPWPSEHADFLWDEVADLLARATPVTFFQRARRIGLRRPWDQHSTAETLHLSSPLAVLSSPAALIDPVVRSSLPGVVVILLDALLEPVFSFLASRKLDAREMDAFVVVPANAGRRARLALHKVFRRRGFRRLLLLPRPLAAPLAHLEEAPFECLVWDVAENDLHLTRVAVGSAGPLRSVQTPAALTVPGLGWSYWVRRIADALGSSGSVPGVDRALMGLLSGSSDSPALPAAPSLRLSQERLREVLDGEWRQRMVCELRIRLEPELAVLGAEGLPVVLLGAVCGLAPLQELFLAASGGAMLSAETSMIDQGARGVGAALLWLHGDPERRIEGHCSGSLRINTWDGDTCEILSADNVPRPGEECFLRLCFSLAGDHEVAPFLLHLLWGPDVAPGGNATLCALPVELSREAASERALWLTAHIRRSTGGRWLRGTFEAGPGRDIAFEPQARGSFAADLATFPSLAQG